MQDAVSELEHTELHFRTGLHGNTNGLLSLLKSKGQVLQSKSWVTTKTENKQSQVTLDLEHSEQRRFIWEATSNTDSHGTLAGTNSPVWKEDGDGGL